MLVKNTKSIVWLTGSGNIIWWAISMHNFSSQKSQLKRLVLSHIASIDRNSKNSIKPDNKKLLLAAPSFTFDVLCQAPFLTQPQNDLCVLPGQPVNKLVHCRTTSTIKPDNSLQSQTQLLHISDI